MGSLKRDVLSVYLATAVNGILGLALVPLSVHIMGVAGYGLFSIYAVVFSYITLVESGFTKNLVRLLASNKNIEIRKQHLHTAFGFYIGISLLLLVSAPILVSIIPGKLFDIPAQFTGTASWIVLLSILEYIIAIPTATMMWYGNADEKFIAISKFNIISGFYRYGLMYAGLLIFRTPEAVVALSASRRLIDFFVVRRIVGSLPQGAWRPSFNFHRMKAMFAHSIPLTAAQVGVTSLYAAPSIIVSRLFGLEALGAYRAIFDVCNRVWFFSGGIGVVVFPKFVRLFASREPTHSQRSQMFAGLYFSWASYLVMAFGGIVLSPIVLPILHLPWETYYGLWALTLIGVCMSAHAQVSYELLQATRRYMAVVAWTLVALVLMIVSGITLSHLGIISIGFGWLISELVYTTMLDTTALNIVKASGLQALVLIATKLIYLAVPLTLLYSWATNTAWWESGGISLAICCLLQVYSVALYRDFRMARSGTAQAAKPVSQRFA
jgi:O-antigen/teichoic acid export membrane protein